VHCQSNPIISNCRCSLGNRGRYAGGYNRVKYELNENAFILRTCLLLCMTLLPMCLPYCPMVVEWRNRPPNSSALTDVLIMDLEDLRLPLWRCSNVLSSFNRQSNIEIISILVMECYKCCYEYRMLIVYGHWGVRERRIIAWLKSFQWGNARD
jgi:hypothetical protein